MAAPTYTIGALPKAAKPWEYTPQQLQAMAGKATGPTTYKPDDAAYTSKSLAQLLATDNPYIQRARTKAAQYANQRGLLNSSIAAGAGEAAAIDAALPIAQSDAQTAFTAQRDNAAAQNQFGASANEFARTGALAALRSGYDEAAQAKQYAFQAGETAAERGQRESQFGRQLAETQAERAQREGQFNKELGFRQTSFGQELGLKQKQGDREFDLRNRDLGLRQQQVTDDRMLKQAQLTQEMERTYLDARTQLETTPALDVAGKARAITAMSDWFYNTSLPTVQATYGKPEAWPAPKRVAPPPPPPAPRPPPAPAPYRIPGVRYEDDPWNAPFNPSGS